MTIINIRGTSGSGKSTIIKRLLSLGVRQLELYEGEGRKRPVGYIYSIPNSEKQMFVVGHYEIACGGCDTLSGNDRIYEMVRKAHENGFHVLYEGLLISAETGRPIALHNDGLPLIVLAIDIPLQECLDSVNARRREKRGADAPPVNPKNTESKWKGVQSSMRKLLAAGVEAQWGTREQVFEIARKELGL